MYVGELNLQRVNPSIILKLSRSDRRTGKMELPNVFVPLFFARNKEVCVFMCACGRRVDIYLLFTYLLSISVYSVIGWFDDDLERMWKGSRHGVIYLEVWEETAKMFRVV